MGATKTILLTGPPGSGKTTVIRRLLELLPAGTVAGFYTEETAASFAAIPCLTTPKRSASTSRMPSRMALICPFSSPGAYHREG
ncbi:MAG: AAA family ATPase, partial [Clostridia bacterium]|nr:AAA family ATPase [Clostridia bacterium]